MHVRPIETTLRNGVRVLIREVAPQDRPLLELGFDRLSDESRYFRFLHPVRRLSERELSYFLHAQGPDHRALGALDVGGPKPEPAGIGRYCRLPERPDLAEIAVTVVDAYQGIGLGSLLVCLLAKCAVIDGVEAFTAILHPENVSMAGLFAELGGVIERRDRFEIEMRIPLFADPAAYPATPTGEVARRAYALLKPRADENGN